MLKAVDNLWRYTGELFLADELEIALARQGIAVRSARTANRMANDGTHCAD